MKKLKFKQFITVIMVFAMVNNLPHSANVYLSLPGNDSILHSYFVVVVLDLTVIALIWKGDRYADLFAFFLFWVNMLSYDFIGNIYSLLTSTDPEVTIDLINQLLAKTFWSAIFAYSIHKFSTLYKGELSIENKDKTLQEQLKQKERDFEKMIDEKENEQKKVGFEVSSLRKTLAETEQKLNDQKLEKEKSLGQVKELEYKLIELAKFRDQTLKKLTCSCGFVAESTHILAGHKAKCNEHHSRKSA